MVSKAAVGSVVSVVVPLYNTEAYLPQCVESLLSQTYRQLEVILVDDGSTDRCPQICDEFAKADQRVRVIHQANGGSSVARNTGIRAASGKFLAFLDSDDYVEKDLFENVVSLSEKNGADIVLWGFCADYLDAGRRLRRSIKHLPVSGTYARDQFRQIAIEPYFLNLAGYAWNKLYSLTYVMQHNLAFQNGLPLFEDVVFNSAALSAANCVCFVQAAYTHYMQRKRITLGTAYYENLIDLHMERLHAQERLLKAWEMDGARINGFVIRGNHLIIRKALHNVYRSASLNWPNRLIRYQALCDRTDFIDLLLRSPPSRIGDKALHLLIRKRAFIALHAYLASLDLIKGVIHRVKYGI